MGLWHCCVTVGNTYQIRNEQCGLHELCAIVPHPHPTSSMCSEIQIVLCVWKGFYSGLELAWECAKYIYRGHIAFKTEEYYMDLAGGWVKSVQSPEVWWNFTNTENTVCNYAIIFFLSSHSCVSITFVFPLQEATVYIYALVLLNRNTLHPMTKAFTCHLFTIINTSYCSTIIKNCNQPQYSFPQFIWYINLLFPKLFSKYFQRHWWGKATMASGYSEIVYPYIR